MEERGFTAIMLLFVLFGVGWLIIEIRSRRNSKPWHIVERRRPRKVTELEPLGEGILKETEEMIDKERLATRDGLKFIMKMMSELYVADMRRTLKTNELVEQFEMIRHKNLVTWIEDHPKLSYFLLLVFVALIVDEIRLPIVRLILAKIGIPLP